MPSPSCRIALLPVLLAVVPALTTMTGCVGPGVGLASSCETAKLQRVLDKPNHGGADLDWVLDVAAFDNCSDGVQMVMQAGGKVTDKTLAYAAGGGNEDASRLFIDQGANPKHALAIVRQDFHFAKFRFDIAKALFDKIARESALKQPAPAAPSSVSAASHVILTPSFHESEHPNDYALIIGVEKYTDLPAATYAENDAEAAGVFVRAMGVPARNMVTLTGAHATRSGMVKQLESWLANNTNENSTVYFYYSGHGAPDPATGQAYLVPLDGDPQYLPDTAYPLKRLYEKLGALKAKRVVVMLDSCFSGAGGRSVLAKGARPLVNNVDTGFKSADGKIVVLTASGADQISGTNEDSGHGLFTYHLLTGLNGAAQNAQGRVTVLSLYDYLKPKVMDDAHRANRDQIPQLQGGGAAAGDVVLRDK